MTFDFWLTILIGFVVLAILLFPQCVNVYRRGTTSTAVENFIIFVLSAFYIFQIGLRDFEVGGDTVRYISFFNYVFGIHSIADYLGGIKDAGIGFFVLAKLVSLFSADPHMFFLAVAFVYITACLKFVYTITQKNRLLFFFAFTACFFFYSMGINVLKSGIALMLILTGAAMDIKTKKIKWLYFILGFLFHASVLLFVAVWFFAKILKKLKFAYLAWFICVGISAAGSGLVSILGALHLDFVESFISDFGFSNYTEGINRGDYTIGFRLDFTLFSGVFIVIGSWVERWLRDPVYRRVLLTYIYLNAFFILAYDMPYSDRIGVISWVLIPMIICYPFTHLFAARNKRKIYLWYFFSIGIGIFSFVLNHPK